MAEQQSPGIFRQQALEHLSTPEQLDQLLQVTTRKSWLPILALGAGLAAAVVWSIVGSIPLAVEGEGILVYPTKLVPFQAPALGQIQALYVQDGDQVSKGDVLGTIRQPELLQRLEQGKLRLAEVEARDAEFLRLHAERMQLEKESIEREHEQLSKRIAAVREAAERRKRESEEYFAKQRENIAELGQLATKLSDDVERVYDKWRALYEGQKAGDVEFLEAGTAYYDNRFKLADAKLREHEIELQELEAERAHQQQMDLVADLEFQILELQIQLKKIDQAWEEKKSDSKLRIQEIKDDIAGYEEELKVKGLVVSEYSGRVSGVTAAVGQIVSAGEWLGFIATEAPEDELVAAIYYNVADGKKIHKDMVAHISPSMIPRERWGSMIGTVAKVSERAVTTDGVTHVVGNPEVARRLTATGNKIEVFASIEPDPLSKSGFKWTSGRGPAEVITQGTTVSVRITVESRRPITYVIPVLKEWSGS